MNEQQYDALILVSFGGPEGRDDVMPFLENVLRGRNVPRERMLEVAEHYYQFDGISPINAQNRALIEALKAAVDMPIYWGNRNWHPLLPDAVEQMKRDGVQRALALVTSAFSSYSSCRQYRENIADACGAVDGAPHIVKIRPYFNHPGFVDANVARIDEALAEAINIDRADTIALFTAHSIPSSMAATCDYASQLEDVAGVIAERAGIGQWRLCYQSRSGPPTQPWLEPDICDAIEEVAKAGQHPSCVICPIGFISDHMEVMFDLDHEAVSAAQQCGLQVARVPTVGTHPAFIQAIVELIAEYTNGEQPLSCGTLGPRPAACLTDCCPLPTRPSTR